MRRLLLIALGLIVAVPVALGASSSDSDLPFSPVGLQQKVAVVACFYRGDQPEDTDITAGTWARVLNVKLNAYYKAATGNKVSFKFLPATSDCLLGDRYSETKPLEVPGGNFTLEDDPATIFREAGQAVLFADEHLGIDHPWAGTDINRLLVIVNRPKRGRATLPPGIYFQTGSSGPKNITVSVVSVDQKGRAQANLPKGSGRDRNFEGVVTEKDIALIAHELGHQLGLSDLYQEAAGKDEYTELWDQMGYDNLQNFSAFSRYVTGWMPPARYRIVNRGTPTAGIPVTISPPLAGGTEAVLLPTGGPIIPQPPGVAYSAPFQGYILEARSHTGLDASRPTLYADGQPSFLYKYCLSMGTPASYEDGVLVSATIGNRETFFPANPLTVMSRFPRGSAIKCNGDDALKYDRTALGFAPFGPDSTFTDPMVNLRVQVLSKTAEGGYKVLIFFDSPPPTPNLVATDVWLDAPSNGFGSFWMPDNDNDGAPDLFGDPVYTPASVTLSLTAPPRITFSTTTHRLSLKVQNIGDGVARDVRGTAYILGGEIPVAADLTADTLGRSSVARVADIRFGDVAPGAFATQTVDITPAGPFVVALLINPNGSELAVLDNLRIEPFLAVQTGSGSPYTPIDMSLALRNLNKSGSALYASPYPLPAGWKGTLDAGASPGRSYALLKSGGEEKFRLQLQPPDPAVTKPGQVKEITLTGYMNYGDTFIPRVKIPVAVVLSYGTALTLVAKGDAGKTSLEGVLTYRDGRRNKPLANTQVRIAVSAAGGGAPARTELFAKTNANGKFNVTVETKKGARYGAVAEYAGSLRYLALRSAAVAFNGTVAATPATTTTSTPPLGPNTPKAYGVADDTGKFAEDAGKAVYASLRAAGMTENRWTLVWGGASTPDHNAFLDRAVPAASNAGIGIIFSLVPTPTSPPLPLQEGFADDFCAWAGRVAKNYPQVKRIIIGNEVNAARFWPQRDGGTGVYYQTLKTCYDKLKEVSGAIQVIGMGLAPRAVSRPASTAPLDFIRAIGAAYRADGRTAPIMDALAIHPYPNPNAKPPPPPAKGGYEDAGFFGVTQLDRVKAALTTAFAGTGQPTTAGGLKLVIDEYGYQTDTAGDERYKGTEGSGVVSEADQAVYYSDAITRILACDRDVSDILLFLLTDESGRGVTAEGGGWQSGLQHPDGTRKPSFDAVAGAIKTGCATG